MSEKWESLSHKEARKLVLLSQNLPPKNQSGSALSATLAALENLGYVQIDTISVIQRAHHHTLWNRNPRYKLSHLDQLVREKKVFEYWSHAAAYLPLCDYRYTLPRKQAIAKGEQEHWYEMNKSLMNRVLNRITVEGPLMAKDFEDDKKATGWGSKPAKQALECLFMQGDLMISRRVNFHKVYDLTERVLPEGIDSTTPSTEDYYRFLITRYLRSNGLGQAEEISYLLKNTKPTVNHFLKELTLGGELLVVAVGNNKYYALPDSLEMLNKSLARSKVKILSPFDNLLIQRKRMRDLFHFHYQIECYVPREKRQFGYFSLPVLWDGKLVARMDCKAHRKESTFEIIHLVMEPDLNRVESFARSLNKELNLFVQFNECEKLVLSKVTPSRYKTTFQFLLFEGKE